MEFRDQLQTLFNSLDNSGSGLVNINEFKTSWINGTHPTLDKILPSLIIQIKNSGIETIRFDELYSWISHLMNEQNNNERLTPPTRCPPAYDMYMQIRQQQSSKMSSPSIVSLTPLSSSNRSKTDPCRRVSYVNATHLIENTATLQPPDKVTTTASRSVSLVSNFLNRRSTSRASERIQKSNYSDKKEKNLFFHDPENSSPTYSSVPPLSISANPDPCTSVISILSTQPMVKPTKCNSTSTPNISQMFSHNLLVVRNLHVERRCLKEALTKLEKCRAYVQCRLDKVNEMLNFPFLENNSNSTILQSEVIDSSQIYERHRHLRLACQVLNSLCSDEITDFTAADELATRDRLQQRIDNLSQELTECQSQVSRLEVEKYYLLQAVFDPVSAYEGNDKRLTTPPLMTDI